MRATKRAWALAELAFYASRNTVSRVTPRAYNAIMRVGGATGRGGDLNGEAGARYFRSVVKDYEVIARRAGIIAEGESLFRGKRILELGPGNTRTVALMLKAQGAHSWEGRDAFDLQSRDERYLRKIYEPALRMIGEEGDYERARALLRDTPVHASSEALVRGGKRIDLVLSRAVLEHVDDLEKLYDDLARVTADDAVVIHKVDLRCHGMRWDNELDFLLFGERAYRRMSSHLGLPNRLRAPAYLGLGERHGFKLAYAATTHVVPRSEVLAVRPDLPRPFRDLPDEALSILGIWLVHVGKAHPLAATVKPIPSVHELEPAPAAELARF